MGRAQRCFVSVVLIALAGCSKASPTAPVQPTPAPAIVAAAIVLTPNSWDLPAGGGSLDITVATAAHVSGSIPAPDIAVRLQTSSGTLSAFDVRTDSTGHAKVTWTGSSSATITATAGDAQATASIRVPAAVPTPPAPAPGPTPNPSPSPAPTPNPSAGPLFVAINASPRLTDEATPVAFSASVRGADGSPNPTGLTYAWDFTEDGQTDSTSPTPTYQFRARDHWTVTVFVRSADGREGLASLPIVVGATPAPFVSVTLAGSPSTIDVGQSVTFTASASLNAQAGTVISYAWDFGDAARATTSTPTTSHRYTTIGSFTARVTASTANANATATTAVRVNDLPLTVGIVVSGSLAAPAGLTFTATVSSAGSVPAAGLVYKWDFTGDTTTDFTKADGPTSNAGWTFNVPGSYVVTVTATATDGRTATNSVTVVVK